MREFVHIFLHSTLAWLRMSGTVNERRPSFKKEIILLIVNHTLRNPIFTKNIIFMKYVFIKSLLHLSASRGVHYR